MRVTGRYAISRTEALTFPMHCPTHGQWWSKRSTQLLHIEQWEHRGGRYSMHVWQYFIFTTIPLIHTFFVNGTPWLVWLPPQSVDKPDKPDTPDTPDTPELSSSPRSGGAKFLGIIPGSVPEVRKRRTMICKEERNEKFDYSHIWGPEVYQSCYFHVGMQSKIHISGNNW